MGSNRFRECFEHWDKHWICGHLPVGAAGQGTGAPAVCPPHPQGKIQPLLLTKTSTVHAEWQDPQHGMVWGGRDSDHPVLSPAMGRDGPGRGHTPLPSRCERGCTGDGGPSTALPSDVTAMGWGERHTLYRHPFYPGEVGFTFQTTFPSGCDLGRAGKGDTPSDPSSLLM